MLERVQENFLQFLRDRDWESFHHPKESSFNLVVEYLELLELFQGDTRDDDAIYGEIGDVCAAFGILSISLEIDLSSLSRADDEGTALDLLIRLGAKIGTILENFQWIPESASRTMKSHAFIKKCFSEAFGLFLRFAQKMGVNPIEAALYKLERYSEKYPIGTTEPLLNQGLNIKTRKRLAKLEESPCSNSF